MEETCIQRYLGYYSIEIIRDKEGNPGIIIKSGGEEAINKVDGISGATMTCDKVQQMLNEAIKRITKEKQ